VSISPRQCAFEFSKGKPAAAKETIVKEEREMARAIIADGRSAADDRRPPSSGWDLAFPRVTDPHGHATWFRRSSFHF
jgi:hypothetical protein